MAPAYIPPHLRHRDEGGGSSAAGGGSPAAPAGAAATERRREPDTGYIGLGHHYAAAGRESPLRFERRYSHDSSCSEHSRDSFRYGRGAATTWRGKGEHEEWRRDDEAVDKDWHRRRDGRQGHAAKEDLSEVEVFGEARSRSHAGIDFDKYDKIHVQVSGNNVDAFKSIDFFSEAKLNDALFENLRRCGYDRPTPVQKYAIPIVIGGRDLMACAQTGSGKTCAFMVPCLENLLHSGPPAWRPGQRRWKAVPCGLVLAPTRELAAQIHVESRKFAFQTGIRCCIVYGGADMKEQRMELERGCDVLIATPGRLSDMCERGNLTLEQVQFFILDEADRMLDMGFEPQVRQIVEHHALGKHSRFTRQSMMFSATFAKDVQYMAQDFLSDYVFITVGRVGSASELIRQMVVYAGELRAKVRALNKAIHDHLPKDGLAVIFVDTKRAADQLELELYNDGVAVACIHGDRSQSEREEALHAFKTGANPVLVATDVAARGLDIPNVSLVVNFDMPKQLDDYVHRIGRTGRAGRHGVAVAFVNERCPYLRELGDLLLEAKQDVPSWFQELCAASARGPFGRARRERRFGAEDLRVNGSKAMPYTGNATAAALATLATPLRGAAAAAVPVRPPTEFGNTGAEDAWDE
eukprot:TRINITY_DN5082_c0_g1_i1.p1 TRINITY_DN5082_c0_g1~~TRINITY_DN5082_c0_g1_i1.p1  ORF type:complete len:637 (+),score=131.14 TRINITY_DN5082_c0_g1_i1:94-2004(+)